MDKFAVGLKICPKVSISFELYKFFPYLFARKNIFAEFKCHILCWSVGIT